MPLALAEVQQQFELAEVAPIAKVLILHGASANTHPDERESSVPFERRNSCRGAVGVRERGTSCAVETAADRSPRRA
jgi:hypothetical protein